MTVELTAVGDRNNWSEVYDLGDTYRKQQQWQQAAIAFQRAIELKPDFFWSYHHLGDVLGHLQQWQQAALAYRRAVELNSEFFWSWHNLGDALSKLKQWQQSALAYRRAVELDSEFFWSWHNLGDALSKLKQWDKAIAVYLQAILLQPETKQIYQKLGLAFKQRGSLQAAIQHYRQLILNPDRNQIFKTLQDRPELLLNIAQTLAREHQTIGAIVLDYLVLEIQPDRTQVLLELAALLQQQNQLEQQLASRSSEIESEFLTRQSSQIISSPKHEPISGQITVKSDRLVLPNQLEDLSSAVGWSPRPLDQVKQALENSYSYVSAWHSHEGQEQLIGFARAVSDGVFHAVLLDILVHPHFQNRGIGKTIVQTLIKQLHDSKIKDITLFASPHIVDFYHKLGFVSQPNNLQWMLWCPNN